MPNTIIRQVISFILLVLLQVLVLNNIHLFGIITPFLYIIFIINLPYNISRHWSLLIAFLLGLVIDVFTNTLGVHILATVFVAYLRVPLLKIITRKSDEEITQLSPSIYSMEFSLFLTYVSILVFSHTFLLLFVDVISLHCFGNFILKVLFDSLFTIVLILCLELVKKH